jgi:hypothetical protein
MNILKQLIEHKELLMKQNGVDAETVAKKISEDKKEAMEKGVVTKAAFDTQTAGNGQEYVPAEQNDGRLVDLMVDQKGLVAMLQPGLVATSQFGQNRAINVA